MIDDPNGFPDLMKTIFDRIHDTMSEGAQTHTPGIWKKEGEAHHMRHAFDHIDAYREHGDEEDREHAFCRLAMALWCQQAGVE